MLKVTVLLRQINVLRSRWDSDSGSSRRMGNTSTKSTDSREFQIFAALDEARQHRKVTWSVVMGVLDLVNALY